MPYFVCGRETYATSATPCTAGSASILMDEMNFLLGKYYEANETGEYATFKELFLTTQSLGSKIVQAHAVARYDLHRRTQTYRLEILDNNPDRASAGKQGNIKKMLANMMPAKAVSTKMPSSTATIPKKNAEWAVPGTAAEAQGVEQDGATDRYAYPLPHTTELIDRFRRMSTHHNSSLQYELSLLGAKLESHSAVQPFVRRKWREGPRQG